MKEEDIDKGNRIIADFIDYPEKGKKSGDPYYYAMKHAYDFGGMKFYSDWNWLMLVLEKIEQYEFEDDDKDAEWNMGVKDRAFIRTFHDNMVRINRFSLHEASTKIEAAWSACVEFIEWYNEQSKKSEK